MPGTVILGHKKSTWGLKVRGKLNAIGTAEEPIVITSWRNPVYGGSGVSTENDYWGGIVVYNTGEFNGEYLKFSYSRYYTVSYTGTTGTVNEYGSIYNLGSLNLTNSEVKNAYSYGIYAKTSIQPDIKYSTFKGNKDYAIYNANPSTITIDARQNYWGSPSGPSVYDSRTGKWSAGGDKVSSGVDYSDWLTEEPYADPVTADAQIVSDTIPTEMIVGKQYQVSITVKNIGDNTWTSRNGYKLGAVDDSDPFTSTRQTLGINDSIAPGQIKTFTFTMTAPTTIGTYITDWQMTKEGVRWFGEILEKQVNVTEGALNLGYGQDGEEYLEDLADELGAHIQNGNSVTYDGKTFICDETNSRIVDGRVIVNAYDFAAFFNPEDIINQRLIALDPDIIICATAEEMDKSSVSKAGVKAMSSGTSSIIQVAVPGEKSENVKNIQKVLQKLRCWVNKDGTESNAKATGLYGEVTQASLIKFQEYYKEELNNRPIFNSGCNKEMAQLLSALYITYFGTTGADDARVIAAKDYLTKLGYGGIFTLKNRYSEFDGAWSYQFNEALKRFIDDYDYEYEYYTVVKLDKPTLYGWLQEKATVKTMYPDLVYVKGYIVSNLQFGEMRDKTDFIGNNTLVLKCSVLVNGYPSFEQVRVPLEMQMIGNNMYAKPADISWAMTHYMEQKSIQGIYAKQWASNLDGIIYRVKPEDEYNKIVQQHTDEDLMKFVNYMGPTWEREYVARTFNDWVDENQDALDLISFLPITFLPAQGANIIIDYVTDGQKKALERAGCIVIGTIGGVVVARTVGALSEALANCGDDVIKMRSLVNKTTGAIEDALNMAKYEEMSSGAIMKKFSEMPVDEWLRLEDLAHAMYNSFRTRSDDIVAIARNTGMEESKILQIKNHLFYEEHLFEDGTKRMFDPNYWQAEAWERLIDGTATDTDILLLNHELFESNFMKENVTTQAFQTDPVSW